MGVTNDKQMNHRFYVIGHPSFYPNKDILYSAMIKNALDKNRICLVLKVVFANDEI